MFTLHKFYCIQNLKSYNGVVKGILEGISKESEQLSQLIEKMLSIDPKDLPSLEKLKSFEIDSQKRDKDPIVILEESKLDKSDIPRDIPKQNPTKISSKNSLYVYY